MEVGVTAITVWWVGHTNGNVKIIINFVWFNHVHIFAAQICTYIRNNSLWEFNANKLINSIHHTLWSGVHFIINKTQKNREHVQ